MRRSSTLSLIFWAVPVGAIACSSSGTDGAGGHATSSASTASNNSGGSTANGFGQGGGFEHGDIVSIAVTPPTATIDVNGGATATQAFTATATYTDGTTSPIAASWGATNPSVGSIDGGGTFTANGSLGGIVQIVATSGAAKGTATLTVKLHVTLNPDNVDTATQTALQNATTPDATAVWAYPYDQMVYPRGIGGPPLMWNGGGATDTVWVHLTTSTFDLSIFKANANTRYDFDPALWQQYTDSSGGAAELKVARFANNAAGIMVDHHDVIAPASMRGTIYYWAINTGRVMRIKPGSATPDDFIGAAITCPSCHTASANGSRLIMNEGSWPHEDSVSYNLLSSSNDYFGLHTDGGSSQWALAGVSADGTVIVQNFAPLRGSIGVQTGAFDAATGMQLPATGLEGHELYMPAFSPDDKLLAYIDGAGGDLRAYDWDSVAKQATNDRLIVAAGANAATKIINAPTISPDHQWIVYQRSTQNGSLGNKADLYVASVANPGTELPLTSLNGTNYPFAAGARDKQYNFEPTFAPVAAGGYFWLVFHSRRTFGNALTGAAFNGEGSGTKQLWVAAIDQAPVAAVDPSHSPFWLPGQAIDTLNMRGYWALDPCKGDGQGCASGTECCGGYCDGTDGSNGVCKSQSGGCSQSGDQCQTVADCCDPAASCINHVCSEPPPN
jgi:WD40-like Beta Propeller Repeat